MNGRGSFSICNFISNRRILCNITFSALDLGVKSPTNFLSDEEEKSEYVVRINGYLCDALHKFLFLFRQYSSICAFGLRFVFVFLYCFIIYFVIALMLD